MDKGKNKINKLIVCICIVIAILVAGYLVLLKRNENELAPFSGNRQDEVASPTKVESKKTKAPTPEEIIGKETPDARKGSLELGSTPQEAVEVKLPEDEKEIANPPLWTQPIVVPEKPLEPPDPDQLPPMKVDPRRKPEDSGPGVAGSSQ